MIKERFAASVRFKTLPHQGGVLPAISAQIKEEGLYIFSWSESPPGTPMSVNEESRKNTILTDSIQRLVQ